MHLDLESESLSVKTRLIATARYDPLYFSRQVSADPTWLRSRCGGGSPSGKVVISRIVPTQPSKSFLRLGATVFSIASPPLWLRSRWKFSSSHTSKRPFPILHAAAHSPRPGEREERAIYKPIFSARAEHRKNPIRLTKCKTLLLLLRFSLFSLRAFSIYHGGGGGGGGVRGRGRVINHGFVGEEDGYRGRTEEEE